MNETLKFFSCSFSELGLSDRTVCFPNLDFPKFSFRNSSFEPRLYLILDDVLKLDFPKFSFQKPRLFEVQFQ